MRGKLVQDKQLKLSAFVLKLTSVELGHMSDKFSRGLFIRIGNLVITGMLHFVQT